MAGPLNLYSHDALFEETFELLGATGLFGRDALRIAFEDVDQSGEGLGRLIEVLTEVLDDGAEDAHLQPEQRERSSQLADLWRELLGTAPVRALADHWTVADVAEHFGVTPQAVGSYLIPAAQFDGIEPVGLSEASKRRQPTAEAQLRARLRGGRREQADRAEAMDARDPAAAFARAGNAPRRRPVRRAAQ